MPTHHPKTFMFVKQNELLKPDLGQFVNRQQSILDALSSSLKKSFTTFVDMIEKQVLLGDFYDCTSLSG